MQDLCPSSGVDRGARIAGRAGLKGDCHGKSRITTADRSVGGLGCLACDARRPRSHCPIRLPSVTKPELMARFDDWVTDPDVTRARVEGFVANLDHLGQDFLGRYVLCTTSGSTGVPALLVQDRRAVAVMTGLAYVRALNALSPRLVVQMLTRAPRLAAVFAQGGHFLSTTMFERRLRTAPFRRASPDLSLCSIRCRCWWTNSMPSSPRCSAPMPVRW